MTEDLNPQLNPQLALQRQAAITAAPESSALADYAAALERALAVEQHKARELEKLRRHAVSELSDIAGALQQLRFDLSLGIYPDDGIMHSDATTEYLKADKYIHAIKQVREDNPGMGLAQAKQYIDKIREQQ